MCTGQMCYFKKSKKCKFWVPSKETNCNIRSIC